MEIRDQFTVSLTAPRTAELYAVQGDSSRTVAAEVFAGAEPWKIPEDVTAEVGYCFPDGTQGCYDRISGSGQEEIHACFCEGNRILVRIAPMICSAPGTVQMVITLRKDGKQISTFPFRLTVKERPGCGDDPAAWPEPVPAFAGRLYWGSEDGSPSPLELGEEFSVEENRLRISQEVRESFQVQLDQLRADMEYEPIAVTSVSIQPNRAQMGAVIENPTLVWEVSRDPVKQMVAGVEIDASLRSYTLEGNFMETNSVDLTVTDERGAAATKYAKMNFYNGIYCSCDWGGLLMPVNVWELPTDEQLLRVHPVLQAGRGMTISTHCTFGEHVLYALPTRLGMPKFWCGGLQAAFVKVGTMAHTNLFGYQEDYDVWVSESDALSGVDIIVE